MLIVSILLRLANFGVVVDLVAVEEGESSLLAKEKLEEVRRVVRMKRFEPLDLGIGLVGSGGGGGELELVIERAQR